LLNSIHFWSCAFISSDQVLYLFLVQSLTSLPISSSLFHDFS